MSFNKIEQVSSLVDDFKLKDEDVTRLVNDAEMSETWQRYHLVGDVLRGEASEQLDIDLSAQIASIIADEPTVLAPQTWQQKAKAQVIAFAKPAGQVAIAASAAIMMIVGVQNTNQVDESIETHEVFQPMPLGGVADPVSYNFQRPVATDKNAYIEQKRRLHAMLNDHKQQLKLHASTETKKTEDEKELRTPKKNH